MKQLAHRTAFVTGAAQGMGKAIALHMAREGANVAVNDLDLKPIRRVATAISQCGVRSLAVDGNVTDPVNVDRMVRRILNAFGRIDILVNNAGILYPTRLLDIGYDEWRKVMDVNINGVFLVTSRVLPIMISNRYGRIINMSSIAGRSVSTIGGAHYAASKAAVLGFTRAMAKEMGRFGITANALCPGMIDTAMTRRTISNRQLARYCKAYPIPRAGTPDEVAQLAVFLASDAAAYITGAAMDINGGDLML
ncbi:MAG: SDR family oxidoreductase [Verrucomicrobia bacterium]|nr:SDR family oxidoreductase [Verrucomicrobiota bacterium]MCG2679967.1 SDR family oxidoreductase [Kiritimatiellia bacterium]MBU4247090.1 SDR family oxidoreductase [Verrucomicrobiota bacterium]MBU4290250.1 SDR family oxidoreductase [Verrucomicrobiota bacterium]MBU4428139.1 SDR family oxidoreductase [Verrucomicrobiota bacterium]